MGPNGPNGKGGIRPNIKLSPNEWDLYPQNLWSLTIHVKKKANEIFLFCLHDLMRNDDWDGDLKLHGGNDGIKVAWRGEHVL